MLLYFILKLLTILYCEHDILIKILLKTLHIVIILGAILEIFFEFYSSTI